MDGWRFLGWVKGCATSPPSPPLATRSFSYGSSWGKDSQPGESTLAWQGSDGPEFVAQTGREEGSKNRERERETEREINRVK